MGVYKCRFCVEFIGRFRRIDLSKGATHDPQRIQGMAEMRRTEAVGDLIEFLQDATWMRTHLSPFAEAKVPQQGLMEDRVKGT